MARYGGGSSVSYSELLAVGALVSARRRVGLWIAGAWVDSATSAAGGRALWGLPKQGGSFEGEPAVVRVGADTALRLAAERPRPAALLPLLAPVFGEREDGEVWTVGYGVAALGLTRARLSIPPGSPLESLGLRPAGYALAGRARVSLPAARRLG